MLNGIQVVARHRTFSTGPMTPFKVKFYRDALGLTILADRSHPEHLEIVECWPTWIPCLFELQRGNTLAVSQFAAQISSHLHVMQGIGSAVDRLNETVERLRKQLEANSEWVGLE
jgi:hypothetical protein